MVQDVALAGLPCEINSRLMGIKYDMEQLLYLWIEQIDTRNKSSGKYIKGILLIGLYLYNIYLI